jgi:hypothetical protein
MTTTWPRYRATEEEVLGGGGQGGGGHCPYYQHNCDQHIEARRTHIYNCSWAFFKAEIWPLSLYSLRETPRPPPPSSDTIKRFPSGFKIFIVSIFLLPSSLLFLLSSLPCALFLLFLENLCCVYMLIYCVCTIRKLYVRYKKDQ